MRGGAAWVGLAMAAASISGCGGEADDEPGEPIGTWSQAAVVCAEGSVLQGIDVSYYQGSIDWAAVAGDGIDFAIARVNHGDFMDPEFGANWNGIRQMGLVRGAYQYFDPGGDPVKQATTLIDEIGALEPGDLPPVIDVESTDGLGPAAIAANVGTWIDLVEGALGRRPIIYTGSYFWNDNVGTDAFNDHPLWIAHYTTGCPNLPTVWSRWALWQYTSSGSVAGIAGNVDRNEFNGSLEALHDLAANGYRASVVSLEHPEVLAPGEQVRVRLTLRNEGARTWGAATKLGTTMPRDRKSALFAPDWEDSHRVLAMPADVPPGESVELVFDMVAPAEPGDYVEHFNLVEEGVAWFSDIVPGGGPSDDVIALAFTVTEDTGDSAASVGAGGPSAEVAGSLHGRVSCAASAGSMSTPSSSGWIALGLAALLTAMGRRRGALPGGSPA